MQSLVFSLLVSILVFSFLPFTNACIGLGCMGIGCLPPPPCLFGGCYAPMARMMSCPCNMGYQCINGGCMMMAKARGAKTYVAKEDVRSIQTIEEPNAHFTTCCKLLDVPEPCSPLCSYDGYTTKSIKTSLQIGSSCPMTALPQVHFCAARGADHTACCKNGNIPTDCLVFCDQRPGNVTQLNLNHLQCFNYLEHIKQCFMEHAVKDYYESKMHLLEKKL